MSGGLGIIDPSSGLHNRRSNNSATNHTEDTEYEDDYVFSRHPSGNSRDGSVSQNHYSTRFSSPVEAGQERNASHPPHHPFSKWGDGEGAGVNKRAATEVDPEDYNMGLSDDEAFERAKSESAALESRTNPATGHGNGNGMSDNNSHIPDGVLRSIEAENEEDKL